MTSTDMNIAQTIADQIGGRAFVMMGTTQKVAVKEGLQFNVGKNSKAINVIRIELEPSDTYRVRFYGRMSSKTFQRKEKGDFSMVYVEDLRGLIERQTGLYLSL